MATQPTVMDANLIDHLWRLHGFEMEELRLLKIPESSELLDIIRIVLQIQLLVLAIEVMEKKLEQKSVMMEILQMGMDENQTDLELKQAGFVLEDLQPPKIHAHFDHQVFIRTIL